MSTLRLSSALSGAAFSLAFVTGVAPAALADPPGYLFQDFATPQATAALLGTRMAANDNSVSAKDDVVGGAHQAMTSGDTPSPLAAGAQNR